jgi:hypothetical protein
MRDQPPDLLVYGPQRPELWFAEVKGPGDIETYLCCTERGETLVWESYQQNI